MGALKPHIQRDWRRHRDDLPGSGRPHRPVLPRRREADPGLQRLAVTPTLRSEIAAPPSPRGRRVPTTPSTVPTGVGAYLRALPPGTPPCSHPQTQEEANTLLWSHPQCAADRSRSGCGRLGRGRPLAGGRRGRGPRRTLTVLRSRPLAGPSSRTHDRSASSQDFAQNFALVACGSAGGGLVSRGFHHIRGPVHRLFTQDSLSIHSNME
ncbi:uncharacterized protein LOC106697174 [Myotis lucifugus]|uniref:uncharacterized protein LOC106697174 n=1 Tax=Myotis lucifugus TaxID=59463 RepID=UPI000CCC3D2B|nr:uncharacterized protein LOC106697174 [Myotis lucifugus]